MSETPPEATGSEPATGPGGPDLRQSCDDRVAWGIQSTGESRWPPLIAVVVTNPPRVDREESNLRLLSLAMIAVITVVNMVALGELIQALLEQSGAGGRSLVFASVPIWITNVIAFGLWYWELDRGGVTARMLPDHRQPDFLFPQMSTPGSARGWAPRFIDYLYTSFTNATAFSPTDTMPLTPSAKLLMMVQSLASLLTVALVIARAVNILK